MKLPEVTVNVAEMTGVALMAGLANYLTNKRDATLTDQVFYITAGVGALTLFKAGLKLGEALGNIGASRAPVPVSTSIPDRSRIR